MGLGFPGAWVRERDERTLWPQGLERSWHLGKSHFPSSWPSWRLPADAGKRPALLPSVPESVFSQALASQSPLFVWP